ncbi:MAG: DEAD/DEAH box helicase [Nocardioides sp.]
MAALSLTEARRILDGRSLDEINAFDVLATLGRVSCLEDRNAARDLLIRVLDQRDHVPDPLLPLLQSLVREHGLFPYLTDHQSLYLADRLALEAHRPDGELGAELVFHAEQSLVYDRLMDGENVVLSAPTSFGKSLVVDAYLDAAGFTNAVVIVPTIALMDETRRRLRKLAKPEGYKVITHSSQELGARNILVMTQERLLEYGDLPPIDFFVIDEFYKLDPSHGESRSSQLNMAFDRLRRTGAQYYLLGPNITALDEVSDAALQATFISTGFTTVATDVDRHHATKDEAPDLLAEECRAAGPGTIVFCSSPERAGKVAQWLLDRSVGLSPETDEAAELADAADWVAQTYHRDWIVAKALKAGIGIHHGRLPRALGQHMVRLFNEGRLPYLLVTSTLIEGVNTAARTVIVLDHTIARKKYDYFTFANIRGRSGRMFQHYVGRVVVFNPEPKPADLTVEIPIVSQSRQASVEVLLHLPDDQLTDESRMRIAPYLDQDSVRVETLRANRGVKLDAQIQAARTMAAAHRRYRDALHWNGSYPTTAQVHSVSELMVEMLGKSGVVTSARQLGTRINLLRRHRGDLQPLIAADIAYGKTVDKAIDDNLNFVRNYAQFQVPTALAAAETIGRDVLGAAAGVSSTAAFAGELENLFQSPYTTVLEEFGLPNAVVRKLSRQLELDHADGLDDVLARLRRVDATASGLHPFEVEMLKDTQASLT